MSRSSMNARSDYLADLVAQPDLRELGRRVHSVCRALDQRLDTGASGKSAGAEEFC